uniref:H+-transporting two-sector ATPase, alpha/beta subunit, central region, putative n=1 Tax=Medicago truncatula TaxID=3880 RepID=Q2HV23_MEDTR|nr:H+-transporting two-sector ATPase, alpha/beta subunit, central region, putative [Medicago truncatula]
MGSADGWWCDVHALCRDEWFSDHVNRYVGSGKPTLFWTDFGLSTRLEGGAWRWRRKLFAWEEELVGELILQLQNVTLQVNKDDKWLWTLETSQKNSVCSVYNFLSAQPPIATRVPVSSLWQKDVSLKVVLFPWQLFRDRLPTKDNLFRRSVLDHNSMECVAGCGSVESFAHLLFHCNFFGSICT